MAGVRECIGEIYDQSSFDIYEILKFKIINLDVGFIIELFIQ